MPGPVLAYFLGVGFGMHKAMAMANTRHAMNPEIDEGEKRLVAVLALLCRSLLTVLREDGTVQPERQQEVMKQIE